MSPVAYHGGTDGATLCRTGAGWLDKNAKFILVKTRLAGLRGELVSAPTTGFPNEHMYLKLWYI